METVSPYTVSATNRSGLIVIVETLFMTWMIIVNLIRLYMRLAINGPVKIDDVVVFTGSDVYAANLLFLAGHGAAKISICLLLKQLGRQKGYLLCSKILLGIVAAWMLGSILAVAFS
ncbi:hypothetical protein AAEP93_002691 [Penicillium crustosum]